MNTTRLITGCLVLASLMGLARNLHAQTTAFTYQGRLEDSNGPVTGLHDFELRLFNAVTGGAQQGSTVNVNNLSVSNGLFTASMDFGAVVFPGADRFLQIAVRTNGGGAFSTLAPRQALTPTPYALFAGKVNASGISGTLAPGNIAAGSITTVMLATGAVGSNQLAAGAVTTAALAEGAVTAAKVAVVTNLFSLTIANPTPRFGDDFGNAVAALGNDRMLIGAPGDRAGAAIAGAAYLFSTTGKLLTTFTNPTPQSSSGFISAERFGSSVAAIGSDRVLIGASSDLTGLTNTGAAYLFRTNGTLLTTFTNPTPESGDDFGNAVAALGNDRMLIGAQGDSTGATAAGAAYLFSTNGTLLTTFTKPNPGIDDSFGNAVAALGNDRLLIGAVGDDTGAVNAGAAYLFRTNGTLLTTFNNPTPGIGDFFGRSVATLGSDRVLIGASGDLTGATLAGAAYVFSTNGTLLTTFNNPTPESGDFFGSSVATLGSDRVLIGAVRDSTGAQGAGSAYLFSTETFNEGLVADEVRARSVTTASLEDGAVTAAKISGVLFASQIPILELDASEITSGVLAIAQIPSLPASKITSGDLDDARLSANVALRNTPQTFKRLTVSGDGAFNDPNAAAIILENTTPVTGRSWQWHSLDNGKMQLADFDAAATRLVIDTAGNVGIGTAFPSAPLQVIGEAKATSFTTTSDRHAKEHFATIDPAEVLQKVAALPITEWSYKTLAGARHVGPMAQDFHAAFGLGSDDKGISTVDADGVALAAIQGLNQKVEVRSQYAEVSIEELRAENAELKKRLRRLEEIILRSGKE